MIKICSLFSGSSGNCIFVASGQTKLLVDCGVSGKSICNALSSVGEDISEIQGILITHEHSDHIKSVGIIHRKIGAKIYANQKTFDASKDAFGKFDEDCVCIFDGKFSVGDIDVTPFSIPHDAADPVGFCLSDGMHKVSIATDIGYPTETIEENIMGSDICLLESNHDIEMLLSGPYPYPLKKRIMSDFGHLSNDMAGELCCRLAESGTKDIILGHLSDHNNIPDLAYVTAKSKMEEWGLTLGDCRLSVASRTCPGEMHIC